MSSENENFFSNAFGSQPADGGYTSGPSHSGFQSNTGSFTGYNEVPNQGLQWQSGGSLNGPFGGNISDSMWGKPMWEPTPPTPPAPVNFTENKPFGSW